jgi:hypothetical protein
VYCDIHRNGGLGCLRELYDLKCSTSPYQNLTVCPVTNPETTELLFRDRSGPAMRYSHIVGNIDDVFDRDDTTAVSAAICAFGVPLPPANPMPSPSYDFSSPYPLINSDRKATTGENARYKFDSTTPAGRAEAIPTPQTSFGYSSPTPRPYPPQYTGVTFESNKGPNQKGIIVGSFFGVAVLVTLLTTLVVWLGKRKLKKTALTSVGQEGAPKPTVRRQWTMLETAEPPPAYEAVATTEPTDHRSSTRPPHY